MMTLFVSTGRDLRFGSEGATFDVPDADTVTRAAVLASGAGVATADFPSQPLVGLMSAGTIVAEIPGHVVPSVPE